MFNFAFPPFAGAWSVVVSVVVGGTYADATYKTRACKLVYFENVDVSDVVEQGSEVLGCSFEFKAVLDLSGFLDMMA